MDGNEASAEQVDAVVRAVDAWVGEGVLPEGGDAAMAAAVHATGRFVQAHRIDPAVRAALGERLRVAAGTPRKHPDQPGRGIRGRTRRALLLAGAAVLAIVAVAGWWWVGARDESGTIEAAEVFRRHSARVGQAQRLRPGEVLHTVMTVSMPDGQQRRESWQLAGADGLVSRSYARMEGGAVTLEWWFDGQVEILRQAPAGGSASVTAQPAAPYRPLTGLGLFDEVRGALVQSGLPGGGISGTVAAPSSPVQYRVTGRGAVAGRETIILESERRRLEFDAHTYDLLAFAEPVRPDVPGQAVRMLEQAIVSQEILRGGARALPAEAQQPPAVDRAAVALRPPAIPPDAKPLAGLPAYRPDGLGLMSTSTRDPDQGPAGSVLSATYRGAAGEVYVQRTPPTPGCGTGPGRCEVTDINGRPGTLRTVQHPDGTVWYWVQWDDSEGGILLSGTLPPGELLKMARSMPAP
jgi:hypothetical protein